MATSSTAVILEVHLTLRASLADTVMLDARLIILWDILGPSVELLASSSHVLRPELHPTYLPPLWQFGRRLAQQFAHVELWDAGRGRRIRGFILPTANVLAYVKTAFTLTAPW